MIRGGIYAGTVKSVQGEHTLNARKKTNGVSLFSTHRHASSRQRKTWESSKGGILLNSARQVKWGETGKREKRPLERREPLDEGEIDLDRSSRSQKNNGIIKSLLKEEELGSTRKSALLPLKMPGKKA